MKEQKLKFKVKTLRTITSPHHEIGESGELIEPIHYLLVNMKDLPENISLDVNPRIPKLTTNVGKTLKEAVREKIADFHLNNRGIVISAKKLFFDPANSFVTIDLGDLENEEDKSQYGILDGGHTYNAIISERQYIPQDIEKYVRVEVIENVRDIGRLSDARNTSVQVSDIALFNLDGKFETIKEIIKGEDYSDKIAYKENEAKPIGVIELLRIMFAFDIDKYQDDQAAPIQSYSGKAEVFKRYEKVYNNETGEIIVPLYEHLMREIPRLVKLYETIELELPGKYDAFKRAEGASHSKFGRVRGVEKSDDERFPTLFLNSRSKYKIPAGYVYPIFGAFRSLLSFDKNTNETFWLFDPIEMWSATGVSLAQNTFGKASHPQLVGKDKQIWLSNYRIVETESLRQIVKRQSI